MSLRVEDCDIAAGMIMVKTSKGRKQGTVPLSPVLRRDLLRYLSHRKLHQSNLTPAPIADRLIVGQDGAPLLVPAVTYIINRLGKRAGITSQPIFRTLGSKR